MSGDGAAQPYPSPLRREFQGVGQQVQDDLTHRAGVGDQGRAFRSPVSTVSRRLRSRAVPATRRAQVSSRRGISSGSGMDGVVAGVDLRQVEQVVDDLEKLASAVVDFLGIISKRRAFGLSRRIVADQFGKADDGVQRGTQFMAHGREELGLRPAALLGADEGSPEFFGIARPFPQRSVEGLQEMVGPADENPQFVAIMPARHLTR